MQVQADGTAFIDATGTIEHAEGYQTTIEGITFTLEGEGLDQVVGQTEEIQGDLIGNDITVTSLTPP